MILDPPLNIDGTRKRILDAVLQLFTGMLPWQTMPSLRFKAWDQIQSTAKPALIFLYDGESQDYDGEGMPAKITMSLPAFIYWDVNHLDESQVPVYTTVEILDRFSEILRPPPIFGTKQTLGGLVSHCWIEGETQVSSGDLDGHGLAVIPLKILIPS